MRPDFLEVLACPLCSSAFHLTPVDVSDTEVRRGRLTCGGNATHAFDIIDGIVRFATAFDSKAVTGEVKYAWETFKGNRLLTDPAHVAEYPDTLPIIWPNTKWFGLDFQAAIAGLDFASDSWTLDIGTAACWTTRLLARKGGHVIAQDVVETEFNGLRTADIQFKAHRVFFERVLESMTRLPYRDASMDRIVFNAAFHHTPDAVQTLSECHRVLKPQGKVLLLSEITPILEPMRRYLSGSEGSKVTEDGSSHHDIPYREFASRVRQAGFEMECLVPAHVQESLSNRFGGPLGSLAVALFNGIPLLRRLFFTSLIILRK